GVEPHAIVLDDATEDFAAALQPDRSVPREGVASDVGERLLNDPVDRRLDHGIETAARRAQNAQGDAAASGETLGQKLEGRNETQIVEDRGTQLVREPSQALLDVVEVRLGLSNAQAAAAREFARDLVEGQMDGRRDLSGLVVELMRDALGLLLAGVQV